MKKEYIVYKLSECAKQACRIDNSLFTSFNVKRGLRNDLMLSADFVMKTEQVCL